MADDTPDPEKKAPQKADNEDIHKEALKRYEAGYNRDRKNIECAYEDLKFAAPGETNQWEPEALKMREGRPILQVSQVPQFVRQITGDMRQMRPAIKVVPTDDRADKEVAKTVLPGMIRYIEMRSDAQAAYFNGADSQVTCGVGHWRILTEYADQDTFNQEIRIAGIEDGVSVIWDPDAADPERASAMWCFVPVDMSRGAFEEKYPDASADSLGATVPAFFRDWCTDDYVRIAEYWRKVPAKRTLALLPSGSVDDLTDATPEEIEAAKAQGARIERRDGYKIERYLVTASEIIEGPDEWPGRHIPIVPIIGEEIKIGREIVRYGVVRNLRDPQRIYNYAISTQTEVIALQPKAPFIGTHTHFEDNQDDWERANVEALPYLAYKPDPKSPQAKPERSQPPVASTGLAELLAVSQSDMNHVTGIYPAALGAQSNETSGRAIQARQREGDTGTFVYIDNFGRAIRRTGQILIDLIPHVYDTQRTMRIVGEDGKVDLVQINQPTIDPNDGESQITLNDVTIGAYDVAIEMGPSFSTKREEARDGMQAFMQAAGPQVAPLYIDLFAKMQDWPLADKIAKRAQLMLPPPIQHAEAQESGEPPPPQPPPPPPPPEVQMKMAEMQQNAQQNAQEQQFNVAKFQQEHALNTSRLQLDGQKLQVELAKINAEIEKARLDHTATMAGHQVALQSAQAAAAGQVAGAAASAQPAEDPRVDDLEQAVSQLRDVVVQIAQALQQQSTDVPQADPNAPPGAPLPDTSPAPPTGGGSLSGIPPLQ